MTDTGYHIPETDWRRVAQPVIDPTTGQLPRHQDPRYPPKLVGGNTGMIAVRLAEGEHPMPGSVGDYYRGGAFGTLFLIDPSGI
jgi:hypothetical protein